MDIIKNGKLDKASILSKLPMFVRPLVGPAIDEANKADFDKDGQSDVVEAILFLVKVAPVISFLAGFIDLKKLVAWFVDHDFIEEENKEKVEIALLNILEDLEKVQKKG